MPCTPAVNASTGPGRAPWITEMGMEVPSSPGRGAIRIVPDALVPGAAVTGPTVKASRVDIVRGEYPKAAFACTRGIYTETRRNGENGEIPTCCNVPERPDRPRFARYRGR